VQFNVAFGTALLDDRAIGGDGCDGVREYSDWARLPPQSLQAALRRRRWVVINILKINKLSLLFEVNY
jgi:hypothetical protein